MKTISQMKKELEAADDLQKEKLLQLYKDDTRSGVISLVRRYEKEKEKLEKEKQRMYQMMEYERKYSHVGYICGIDEVELRIHTRELCECEQVLAAEVQSEVLYMDLLHPFARECISQGDVLDSQVIEIVEEVCRANTVSTLCRTVVESQTAML